MIMLSPAGVCRPTPCNLCNQHNRLTYWFDADCLNAVCLSWIPLDITSCDTTLNASDCSSLCKPKSDKPSPSLLLLRSMLLMHRSKQAQSNEHTNIDVALNIQCSKSDLNMPLSFCLVLLLALNYEGPPSTATSNTFSNSLLTTLTPSLTARSGTWIPPSSTLLLPSPLVLLSATPFPFPFAYPLTPFTPLAPFLIPPFVSATTLSMTSL